MKRLAALLSLSLLASGAALAGTPATTVYCIDDATEFSSVLSALNALSSHDRNYEFRFRPGTFPSNTTYPASANFNALIAWRPRWVTVYDHYTFKISGEWNAGCTAQNPPGGTTSTINGLDVNAILYTYEYDYTATNYTPVVVEIDRIDFWRYNGYAVLVRPEGGPHSVKITNSRFRNGIGTAISANTDTIELSNSLFENNTTGSSFFSLVDIDTEGASYTTNNTFRSNTLPSGSQRVLIELGSTNTVTPSGYAVFENNVIYQTTLSGASDLLMTDTLARIRNNIFDTTLLAGSPLFISNNYNINPKFAFSAGAQLAADSPARDIGNNAALNGATLDLYGRTRVQNQVVDLGAYELTAPENLLANGFE